MSHVTVLVDSREKKPLTFPAHLVVLDRNRPPTAGKSRTLTVRTQSQTLKTGDYRLVGGNAAIERKGSFEEIAGNCLTIDGRRRFMDCCRRLRDEVQNACLLFEGLVGGFEVRAGLPHPGVAADALLDIIGEHGLPLMLLPLSTTGQRRAAGEWALRWLLSQERNGTGHHHHGRQELPPRNSPDGIVIGNGPEQGNADDTSSIGGRNDCVRDQPELRQDQDSGG